MLLNDFAARLHVLLKDVHLAVSHNRLDDGCVLTAFGLLLGGLDETSTIGKCDSPLNLRDHESIAKLQNVSGDEVFGVNRFTPFVVIVLAGGGGA